MKIYLDNRELDLKEQNLPILIHGEEGSGASLYTIVLAANFFRHGYKLIFLCGYKMAQEEFILQTDDTTTRFYTKEQSEEFKKYISENSLDKTILVIKNVELFKNDVLSLVLGREKFVISGDINKSLFENTILDKKYKTNILFSNLENFNIPPLKKYEGIMKSDNITGITTVKDCP